MGASKYYLTNNQLAGEIISLIDLSEKYCFLVTPYYKPWNLLLRSLEKASLQNKKIIFIIRYGSADQLEIKRLINFGFDVHLVDRLHSKLYLNERTVILTSMNLYDSSKENNYEVGYKFSSVHESKMFKEEIIEKDILALPAREFFPGRYDEELKRIAKQKLDEETKIKEAELATMPNHYKRKSAFNNFGYCIRCRTSIRFDPSRPYCVECFNTWIQFQNENYVERFCHSCGAPLSSSMSRPLCYNCFKELEQLNLSY